jgi:voltage-dependent potassium channel beta subunit
MMQYRRLGNSGLKVSALSLGGWTTFGELVKDQGVTDKIIERAYAAGINFFDIADIYARGESELMMGKVLAQFPRHTLVISSKVFWPMSDDVNDRGLSRKHIFESVHKSLKRVGTDYLDLYFCHRYDDDTPLEETIRAMDDLIHQGKILYWGTSEWTGAQIQAAFDICEKYNLYKPQVEQPQYSLLVREKFEGDILPLAKKNGFGLVVWSPLASGVLTGKYDEGIPEDSRLGKLEWLRNRWIDGNQGVVDRVKEFKMIADELGVTRSQLAIAWTLNDPDVSSAITGATRVEQLEETLNSVEIRITPDVAQKIEALFGV